MQQKASGERTLYRKIEAILGCAHRARGRVRGVDGLIEAVVMLRSSAFTDFRAHKRKGSALVPCSRDLVAARIQLCVDLGLVDADGGRLTQAGLQALEAGQFESVVGHMTREYLMQKGFDLAQVESRIALQRNLSWLPTARNLHENEMAPVELRLADFGRLLGLLGECGFLGVVQSRIYVPTPRANSR